MRPFVRLAGWLIAGSCPLFIAACAAAPGPSPLNYTVQRVSLSQSQAMDSAEVVLAQLGYAIARRDSQEGVLTTRPLERAADGPSRQGAGLSSSAATRRVVEVRFQDAPEGARLFCKVAIEERVTQAYQMGQVARAGDDTPGQTAIERDAAASAAQNTVWQPVTRDKRTERAILAAIADRSGEGSVPPAPP
jgi:hypothetical protein